MEKKKGYFSGKKYTVKVAKTDYLGKTAVVDTTVNGWYIGGNLIFGGLIGYLIVDPLTGAMWSLDSNELSLTLDPVKPVSGTNQSLNLGVVLLQDVPVALRYKMVKIQ